VTGPARVQQLARDPYVSSLVAMLGLGLAGLLAIGLGAVGAADGPTLDAQIPYVVSGGLGGLSLVMVAGGLHIAQRRRLAGARRRAELDRVLEAAAGVLAQVRDR